MKLDYKQLKNIAKSNGAVSVRLFGSFAKGEENEMSDIDLLVELEPNRSLFDIIAIKQEIEDIYHRKVDVVTEKSLSPYLRNSILSNAISI